MRLPPRRRAIGVKWVLKVQRLTEGCLHNYKARLVAKGCKQQQGIDYSLYINVYSLRLNNGRGVFRLNHMHVSIHYTSAYSIRIIIVLCYNVSLAFASSAPAGLMLGDGSMYTDPEPAAVIHLSNTQNGGTSNLCVEVMA